MSTLIDVNIPYASGNVGAIIGPSAADSNGFAWCWFGGDNGRKTFSIRMQGDENYWFVEVAEADDLQANPMTKTVLYARAINSQAEGLYTTYTQNIELCRLSSSAVYMKVLTSIVGNGNNSQHFVIEIDESNNNEVSVTDVNDQMPSWLRGGAYSNADNAYEIGGGLQHRFMHQLSENKIVTYEASYNSTYGYGNLVERSWDPVTKSLTNRIICSNSRAPAIRNNADWRTNPSYEYGDTWSFVPELDQNGFQVMRPSDIDPDGVTSYSGWPVMGGSDNDYLIDSNGRPTLAWMNVVTGRDGLIHFNLASEMTGNTATHGYQYLQVNMYYGQYVMTYNPADGSWGLTGRKCDDTTLPFGRDDFGTWLPLNTMTTSDYATEESIDTSTFNGVTNSRVFKTWMFVGGRGQQVQGISTGSPIDNYDAILAAEADMEQSFQTVWLDYDHFITFGFHRVESSGMSSTYTNSVRYAIFRYYDENKIDFVSGGSVPGQFQMIKASNTFQRPTANTFLSDRFANDLVTLSAGSSPTPADSDGA